MTKIVWLRMKPIIHTPKLVRQILPIALIQNVCHVRASILTALANFRLIHCLFWYTPGETVTT